MNNSTLPVCADQSLVVQKTIVGICYSLMCIAGILAYSLFIVVVSSYKSTTFKNSFYTLALSLAVPDILTLLGQLFYCVPAIFHCDLPVGYEFYAGLLVNTSWYILSTHMIIISVNRFVAVVLNYHYAEWFSFWRTYLMIAASISYGIIMRSIFHYSSCSYMYWGYGWDIKCESEFGKSFINVDTALGEATVVFIVLIYIWIFVYVKIQGTKISNECLRSSQAKRERNLMLQFLLIALVLVIYEGFFWLIPKLKSLGLISGNKTLILVNAFGILNSALPPFLYMTFGSELRRIISSKSGMVASIKSLRPNSAIGGRLVVSQSIGGQVLRASTNIDEIDV